MRSPVDTAYLTESLAPSHRSTLCLEMCQRQGRRRKYAERNARRGAMADVRCAERRSEVRGDEGWPYFPHTLTRTCAIEVFDVVLHFCRVAELFR